MKEGAPIGQPTACLQRHRVCLFLLGYTNIVLVALITGGTSGIGKAAAQAVVRAGAKVVICGRNQECGQEIVCELTAMNGDVLFVKTDVSKAV